MQEKYGSFGGTPRGWDLVDLPMPRHIVIPVVVVFSRVDRSVRSVIASRFDPLTLSFRKLSKKKFTIEFKLYIFVQIFTISNCFPSKLISIAKL